MIRKIIKREYWARGSGEFIGFMTVVPAMTILLLLLVSVIQVGIIKNRMEYVTYAAARAAVVSSDIKEAKEQAEKAAKENTKITGGAKVILEGVSVDVVDPVTGEITENAGKKKKKSKNGREYASGSGNNGWGKGTYVRVTVKYKVNPVIAIISGGDKENAITMMVEEGNESLLGLDNLG